MDRAHREFSAAQLELLANAVRLYRRGEAVETVDGSAAQLAERFPDGVSDERRLLLGDPLENEPLRGRLSRLLV